MEIDKNKFTEKELEIINKYRDVFEALENYDKTGKLTLGVIEEKIENC